MKINIFTGQEYFLEYLKTCEWSAGRFLFDLINENRIEQELGLKTKIFFLEDENKIISFCTLSQQDCIKDDTLKPWIGFVYVDYNNRGHKYSQLVIEEALKYAKSLDYKKVYLATDHIGFYEKYGFIYWKNEIDIYNENSRIYYINLN